MKLKILFITVFTCFLSLTVFSSNGDNYVEKTIPLSADNYLSEMSFVSQQSNWATQLTIYVLDKSKVLSYFINFDNYGSSHYPNSSNSSFVSGISSGQQSVKINLSNAQLDGKALKINVWRIDSADYKIQNNGTGSVDIELIGPFNWGNPYIQIWFE